MRGVQVFLVKLGWHDQIEARTKGIDRAVRHRGQYEGKWSFPNHQVEQDGGSFEDFTETQIMSVAAEIAVARYFRLDNYEANNNSFKHEADVGKNVEVKYSKHNKGRLIVRPNDRDSDYSVLVTGSFTHLYLKGWHNVATAKQAAYLKDCKKCVCWWVPQDALAPMHQLHMIKEVAYASSDRVQAL